jgi:hypothetical protein
MIISKGGSFIPVFMGLDELLKVFYEFAVRTI